jgi:hypothetical protein
VLRQQGGKPLLDVLQNIQNVIDAPPQVLLACPVGIIAALHFASASTDEIKGARCDQVVRQAKAAAVQRPAWIKALGIGLGLGVAGGNFMYLQDPNFWPIFLNNLPLGL